MNRNILFLAFGIALIGVIESRMIGPIMALYAQELGATVALIGLIIGMYSIVNTPANIFFGLLIDRVGYKTPLILGLLGDSLSMFLYSLCGSPWLLLMVCGFHGFTGAILGPAVMSLFADHSPPGKGARNMGLYGMASGLAPLIGFMITGIIMRFKLGFDAVFYTGALILLVGVVLALLLPGDKPKGKQSENSVKKLILIAKRGPLITSYISVFTQWFILGTITALLPLFMKDQGMTAFHFSMVLIALSLSFVIFQLPSGFLSDKIGRKIPAISGLALVSVSMILFPIFNSFHALILVAILFGLGMASLFPSIAAMITDNSVEGERGSATGIFQALLTTGTAVGAPVIGMVAAWVGVSLALQLSSLVAIAAIFVVFTFTTSAPLKSLKPN